MKVTFSMLIRFLEQEKKLKPLKLCENKASELFYIRNLSDKISHPSHTLVIVDLSSSDLTGLSNLIFLCDAADRIPDSCFSENFAVFASCHLSKIKEMLESGIVYYQRIQEEILSAIADGASPNHVISLCHKYLGNPLILHTMSMKQIAATREDVIDHPMWKAPVYTQFPAASTPEESKWLSSYGSLLQLDGRAVRIEAPVLMTSFISCAVLLDGNAAAILNMAEKTRHAARGDFDFIENLCQLLSFELQRYESIRIKKSIAYEDLVRDLLENQNQGEQQIRDRAMIIGWRLGTVHCVVCLMHSSSHFIAEAKMQHLLEDLIHHQLPGKGIFYQDLLVFILSANHEELDRTRHFFENFCHQEHLRCGWSLPYPELSHTSEYFYQAKRALVLSGSDFCCYKDVVYSDMISVLRQNRHISHMRHPALSVLQNYDRMHQTELYRTLEVYCNALFHQSRAAQILHIHRTTIIYRLQKISELTGIDLADPQELHHIYLTFRLDDLAQKEPPTST